MIEEHHMALTRRNTIVGLGALAAGAGVIGGTGAFTAVEAERSVEINAEGDSSALLQLVLNTEDTSFDDSAGDDDVIEFDLAESVNLNAQTWWDDLLTITNNGENDIELEIENGENGDNILFEARNDIGSGVGLAFVSSTVEESGGSNVLSIGSGDSEDLTMVIDLYGTSSTDDVEDEQLPGTINLIANAV